MNRRDMLKGVIGLQLTGAIASGHTWAQPAAPKGRRFIDVHCHFFNAADLPVRGFISVVVLSDYAAVQAAPRGVLSGIRLGIWKGLAGTLADFVLRSRAPTPREELQCLSQAAACGDFAASPTRSIRPNVYASRLADILDEQLSNGGEGSRLRGLEQEEPAFLDFVLEEMKAAGIETPGTTAHSLRAAPADRTGTLSRIADFLLTGRSVFSRYFEWARLLSSYRSLIAQQYLAIEDPSQNRIALATPALVDYNYWLDDQSPASLKEQIAVMRALSLRQPRPVHAFVPFDPLRAVRGKPDEPTALAIVQEAIRDHGFLGVKLYSPMGFRPRGNAERPLSFPAHASMGEEGFGRRLDEALTALYRWCHDEEVPILAHSLDSQAAGDGFGGRADPRFWLAVLEEFPSLRLNLAHFGYFTHALAAGTNPLAAFERTWEHQIGTFVGDTRFSNVFADISYFWWALPEGRTDATRLAAVKVLFTRYFERFDPRVERLMFGTDWIMTGRANGFDRYADNVESFFREIGLTEPQLDNLFYGNAVRFLGLVPAAKPAARLEKFYRDNGRTPPSFT
jgi:predicted TIM-barrel fold metal-dependent hydrolase